DQLAGAPAVLQLPTDRPRPAVEMYRGGRLTVALSRGQTDALHGLSRSEGVALFMTLLGAFQALLHGCVGVEGVVVGTAIAGRPRLTASPVELGTGTAQLDLMASATQGPWGLRVTLEYNTDLYDAATIRRMLGHYETLPAGIVADPGQRLSRLPLVTAAERHQ